MTNKQLIEPTEFLAAKCNRRNAAIDLLVANAVRNGESADRLYHTLIFDFEHAPMTTNLQQLAEIGITVQPTASLSDDEVGPALEKIINGLAQLGVFLTSSNHLNNKALYERLLTGILPEPIRDLPPSTDVVEWIDLNGCEGAEGPVCNRDAGLPRPVNHPLLPQAHTDGQLQEQPEPRGKPILSTNSLRPKSRKARKLRSTSVS